MTEQTTVAPNGQGPVDDPDAPHGRDEQGVPLAPFGHHSRTGRPKKTAAGAKPRGQSSAPTRRAARRPSRRASPSYKEGVLGYLSAAAFALSMAGRNNPLLAADAAAVAIHAEDIATAVDELARERSEIAAALDKLLQAGPYAVLVTAVAPLALQVLANRRMIEPGQLGTVPPEQLVAAAGMSMSEAMANASQQGPAPDGSWQAQTGDWLGGPTGGEDGQEHAAG